MDASLAPHVVLRKLVYRVPQGNSGPVYQNNTRKNGFT